MAMIKANASIGRKTYGVCHGDADYIARLYACGLKACCGISHQREQLRSG
jgi:hypothetical protein